MTSDETRAAIRAVLKRQPDLTIDGLDGPARPAFESRRDDLVFAVDEFAAAVAWLSRVPKRVQPNRNHGHSYYLKHVIETRVGVYISNGALVAAALHLGFVITPCPSRINCWIGIAGKRSWPR